MSKQAKIHLHMRKHQQLFDSIKFSLLISSAMRAQFTDLELEFGGS